jgi:hypothetical protein
MGAPEPLKSMYGGQNGSLVVIETRDRVGSFWPTQLQVYSSHNSIHNMCSATFAVLDTAGIWPASPASLIPGADPQRRARPMRAGMLWKTWRG